MTTIKIKRIKRNKIVRKKINVCSLLFLLRINKNVFILLFLKLKERKRNTGKKIINSVKFKKRKKINYFQLFVWLPFRLR